MNQKEEKPQSKELIGRNNQVFSVPKDLQLGPNYFCKLCGESFYSKPYFLKRHRGSPKTKAGQKEGEI